MPALQALTTQDFQGLSASAAAQLAQAVVARINEQDRLLEQRAAEIKFKDAKIESITFELARFRAWRFGAKTEAMNQHQREIFEETCAADQASLEAQLAALQGAGVGASPTADGQGKQERSQPKREALPAHLPRVDKHVEPQDTKCPNADCRQPMQRVGEDVSERLDIVPAQFFVQRQIRGKWACKCCQLLVQEPAAPQIFDNALPTPALQAHCVVSRFCDHVPYYRQEHINARSGVHTPRSTLASWAGNTGVQLLPLFEAHRQFVLSSRVLHADETPIGVLDPGAGKTKRGYMWAYARGAFDEAPGVVFDFCAGRGGKYVYAFLKGWAGTLVVDAYSGYDATLATNGRTGAHCLAHARRKFDELFKANASAVAALAIERIAGLYRIEAQARALTAAQRLQLRQAHSAPLWQQLHVWLQLERRQVPDGSATAKAIDYSLNHWTGLSRFMHDGEVPIDNNHIENLIRPWALGRRNWLFIGSQLAGERAAVIMSLLQSAKLNGHDPWAYLRDVLTRLPTQLNGRIEELLPHRWQAQT